MTVSTSWATSLGQSWTTSSGILDTRKLILETGQEFNQPRRIPAERDSGCTTWTLRTRTGCAHPRNRPNSTLKSWQTTVSLSENKQSEGHKKIPPMPGAPQTNPTHARGNPNKSHPSPWQPHAGVGGHPCVGEECMRGRGTCMRGGGGNACGGWVCGMHAGQ